MELRFDLVQRLTIGFLLFSSATVGSTLAVPVLSVDPIVALFVTLIGAPLAYRLARPPVRDHLPSSWSVPIGFAGVALAGQWLLIWLLRGDVLISSFVAFNLGFSVRYGRELRQQRRTVANTR